MSGPAPSVLVIGGGVIGCAIGWRLAGRGARVTVLDRAPAGGPASFAAGGMLSPLAEAHEPGPFLDLGLRSLGLYPAFVRELESATGQTVGYRPDGRLDVALDAEQGEGLRERARLQTEAGHESRLLEPPELRARAPSLTTAAVLGLETPHDHQVDNERLTRTLRAALERAGAAVRGGEAVAEVLLDRSGARATGVLIDSGERLEADAVVVAAGAWSGLLRLPTPLPVRPVRGQIVVLTTPPDLLDRVTWGAACYLIPRADGRLLVGATMEEAGFEAHPTAEGTRKLLEAGISLVPALADAPVAGFQTGLRPGTPDRLPIIGRDPSVEGLFHATGHFRNGILLAPATAELLVDMVLEGAPAPAAFSAARFQEAGGDQGSEQSRV